MKPRISIDFICGNEPSSLGELFQTCPETKEKDLIDIANFISLAVRVCPTMHFVICSQKDYPPYLELDNYTILQLTNREVVIKKASMEIITSMKKAIEILLQVKPDHPNLNFVANTLRIILPKLIERTFFIRKINNSVIIDYY